jgi:hypothetical protein
MPTPTLRGLTITDVVVLLVVLSLGGTFVLAAAADAEEKDRRVKCASNLRMIGQAMLLYSNDNRGAFPRARADIGAADKPIAWSNPEAELAADEVEKIGSATFSKNGPAPNDVSAALFVLLRTQDVKVEAFLCPSAARPPIAKAERVVAPLTDPVPPNRVNFTGAEELSYSYANPYPSATAIGAGYRLNNAVAAEFVLAGDMNPASEVLTKLTAKSDPAELRKGNSPNHGLDGQNILCGDGHVEFIETPFAGVDRDNIYTYGDSGDASGGTGIVGSPVGPADTVLLPIVEPDNANAAPHAPAAPAPPAAPPAPAPR